MILMIGIEQCSITRHVLPRKIVFSFPVRVSWKPLICIVLFIASSLVFTVLHWFHQPIFGHLGPEWRNQQRQQLGLWKATERPPLEAVKARQLGMLQVAEVAGSAFQTLLKRSGNGIQHTDDGSNNMFTTSVADKITYYPQWTRPKWVVPYRSWRFLHKFHIPSPLPTTLLFR